MADDSLMDFDDSEGSDFAPVKPVKTAKPKSAAPKKATAPKKAAAPPKPRGRPPKDPSAPPKPKAKAAPKKKSKAQWEDDENTDVDMDEVPFDDESLLADTPPKQKTAPAPRKAAGKPMADITGDSFEMDLMDAPPSGKKAAGGVSSKYQMV